MVLTAEPMTADEAHRWGLVNEVVAPDEVMPTALRIAERIAANAPLAVAWSRRVLLEIDDDSRVSERTGWRLSELAASHIRDSADAREGARAFAEKRAPNWVGA
jgi:crotonobetainyl-CoA hydratase